MMRLNTCFVILFLAIAVTTFGQEAIKPRPSPLAIVSARYKDTYFKITYSQPHKKERIVFGNLVPYGQVWRTGANEATELTITKDVFISGQLLSVGTYSLFTIPQKEKWTIIINKEQGLWGSYNYNPKLDVFRFDAAVQPLQTVVYEPFTIILDQKNNKAELSFLWDKTKVSFPIEFIEPKL